MPRLQLRADPMSSSEGWGKLWSQKLFRCSSNRGLLGLRVGSQRRACTCRPATSPPSLYQNAAIPTYRETAICFSGNKRQQRTTATPYLTSHLHHEDVNLEPRRPLRSRHRTLGYRERVQTTSYAQSHERELEPSFTSYPSRSILGLLSAIKNINIRSRLVTLLRISRPSLQHGVVDSSTERAFGAFAKGRPGSYMPS